MYFKFCPELQRHSLFQNQIKILKVVSSEILLNFENLLHNISKTTDQKNKPGLAQAGALPKVQKEQSVLNMRRDAQCLKLFLAGKSQNTKKPKQTETLQVREMVFPSQKKHI